MSMTIDFTPSITVGDKIPNEVSFSHKGGCTIINMASWIMDHRFRRHLSKLQVEAYEFSEICRNENEKLAFQRAIQETILNIIKQ